ncbi:MAG: SusC/RagA family TonB-linked outer membrane protein [Porphyromonas sp.]|nr:SusC/RagA family TonB-linked outer membrane protein [Porphyromonas sp.]
MINPKFLGAMSLVLTIPLSGVLDATLKAAGTNGQSSLQEVQHGKNIVVKGKVVDKGGEAVIGANILVKGTSTGAVTDLDGNYTLSVSPNATLVFSYIGMKSQTVAVNNRKQIDVTLEDEAKAIDAVVVTALGIKRSEKALSYNVQKVDNSALTKVKEANFVNSLSGKVAGVNITRSSAGIGGATSVVMRGSKSIAGNNNVLYVVDGMPIGNASRGGDGGEYGRPGSGEGISDFNSDDIESISVLTGPSAAALYGASAANGVIIINTKKGAAGSVKVNFSSNTEFLSAGVMPEFQNTYGTESNTYRSWGKKLETPSTFNPRDFFQGGYNTINSLNLSGGTDKNQTFVSVATTHAEGIIPNNEYYRYNFSGRNSSKFLNDKLHLDISANYVMQGDQNMMSGGRFFNPLRPLYLFPRGDDFETVKIWERYDTDRRFNTQYWPYGTQGEDFENPYWIVNREMFTNEKHRYMFSFRAQYDILSWMNIAARTRVDNTYSTIKTKFYATTNPLFTGDTSLENAKGSFSLGEERYKQTYADLMLNINKKFDKDFVLTANIGTSFEDHYTTSVSVGGRLKTVPNLFSTPNVDPDVTGGGGQSYHRTRNIAAFASAELGWKSMLYLTATGRTDWASQLVSNGKTPAIFYPSVGLSGVISEMVKLPSFISYLKTRVSFTEVGSPISQTGITPGTITYSMSGGKVTPISTYPYPDFNPERTRSWEAGLNARLFKGKVHLDATIYQSNTYNQTFLQNMSDASGYSGFYIQAGDIRNRGVELALGYEDNINKNISFSTNLTYTRNVNQVMELVKGYKNPIDGTVFDINVLTSPKYMRPGDSMNDIFVQGILVKGKDGRFIEEGDGYRIDRSQRVKVGSSAPDFMMGWNNTLNLYGVNVSFLISARVGGNVSSSTQAMMDGYGVSKVTADARDAGAVVIDGQSYDPKRYYTTIGLNRLGAYYLYDATNIKLQELSIGYTLPKKWFGKVISNASVSLIARNLLTIYRAAPYDSDMAGGTGTYSAGGDNFMPPSMRSVGFSLNLGF